MNKPTRRVTISKDFKKRAEQLVSREWLVTAGNGSYACGTLGFVNTRRHHGLLIANLPAPQGRTLSLASLREEVFDSHGESLAKLWGIEIQAPSSLREDELTLHNSRHLESFTLDCGFPTWTYRVGKALIEKSIVMPYQSSAVCIRYRMIDGDTPLTLHLRPMMQFRGHNDSVATPCVTTCKSVDDHFEFLNTKARHRLAVHFNQQADFQNDPQSEADCFYRVEQSRGYDHVGDLESPGIFEVALSRARDIILVAKVPRSSESSSDRFESRDDFRYEDLFENERKRRHQLIETADLPVTDGIEAELVLAADQFIIKPASRKSDEPSSNDFNDRRSIIAGYPWFTDWGRDTMISLPGLTLATGRPEDARRILLTFGDYVRDGLIPNLFPEGGHEGMYHTADATLWFFQAIYEYVAATHDDSILEELLPRLKEIIDAHFAGTHFGIHVDHSDGLLVQGQHDVQLTWMDAKAGDWVVTPRRGKAVEINALWYNALHLYCQWIESKDPASQAGLLRPRLNQTFKSFNRRFWSEERGYLFDVVDGENGTDDSLRPNQLFAISLANPVLDPKRYDAVLQSVIDHLLTPVGLRSLAKSSNDYIGEYHGDVFKRDAAYHQGTVWSWLIGPLVKAWCRAHPGRRDDALPWISGFTEHLGEACIGQISEIFEGNSPHQPKGCFAQAWGVAELLEARRAITCSEIGQNPDPSKSTATSC